jgi:hypothetical protein
VELGFTSPERAVRLAAARASEATVLPGALTAVQRAWSENADDPFLGALLLRVMASARPETAAVSLQVYAERFGEAAVRRYADELLGVLGGGDVARWRVLGPLALEPDRGDGPPALDVPGGPGAPGPEWTELAPAASGYVDLAGLGGADTERTRVLAQVWLRSAGARAVPCAFGSDDGGRVWLGDELVYANRARKQAHPLEKLLTLELQPGWNRVLLEIENATGGFGFHFRVLAADVETALAPR